MIVRRTLLIISALLAVLTVSGVALLTSGQLAKTINWLLPKGWNVEMSTPLSANWQGTYLPDFTLSYQRCPLFTLKAFKMQWVKPAQISVDKATIDYPCLAELPENQSSDNSTPDSLQKILPLLPNGAVVVKQLVWVNLPDGMQERLKALLNTPSFIEVVKYDDNKWTASLQQQGGSLRLNFANRDLTGSAHYQFGEREQHQLHFTTRLHHNILHLPSSFSGDYHWNLPKQWVDDPVLQQGSATLSWHTNEQNTLHGILKVSSDHQPENQLTFPLLFNQQSLEIQQAELNWRINKEFALRGFMTAKATPNSVQLDNLFPIKTALRLSLLSENKKGKGNIVLNSPDGEWNEAGFHLPVNIHGNVKQGNFILYSAVPLLINGEYRDPTLRFLPSALVRIAGKERFLDIQDLRFPLAGIRIDKYGIDGRLQAIFHGESPDFSQIKLHLDGYANHFNAGQGRLFQPSPKESVQDRWQWRFWGGSQLNALKNQLNLAGRGHWAGNQVELSEFNGNLGKITSKNLTIPYLDLNLLEPILLDYENWQLQGGMRLNAPQVAFAYGGELVKPTAQLNFNGEIENLRLNGVVSAGSLGPIRLFARRQLTEQSSHLIGRLYWQEQPANVFQTLLPFRAQWLITGGTIRGETAFSANEHKGVVAGGHFAIRQGSVSFPSGDLNGIEFSLPYKYQQSEIELGTKQALEVKIAEINIGLPLRNARVKVQGRYPYSRKSPLFLRELSVELLGGQLDIAHLALPQRKEAYFNLREIDLEKVLELAQYHQLALQGKLNATLPFWLMGKPCYVCNGSFAQIGVSHLKFTPQLLEAMKKSGYTEQLLTYLVNDSQITALSGKVQVESNGVMKLRSSLKTHLNEHQKAQINLNYMHQENLFDLWKLINFGSQFEQQIEHQLYQKLDNR